MLVPVTDRDPVTGVSNWPQNRCSSSDQDSSHCCRSATLVASIPKHSDIDINIILTERKISSRCKNVRDIDEDAWLG